MSARRAAPILAAMALAACGPRAESAPLPIEPVAEAPFEEAAPPIEPITLFMAGDALLTRLIGRELSEEGFAWPFSQIRDRVQAADLAFVNMECPASFVGAPFLGKPENVTFRADPGVLLSLVWAGFDVICLANNHMTDYGREAAAETAALLDVAGLAHCGAGANLAEARKPAVLSSGGVSVAIVAYVQSGLGSVEATEDSGGVALAKDDYLAEDIRTARAVADIVIVSVHWGDEFQHVPNRFQVDFARKAIDSGADAVVGHHPHVIQGAEIYQGKPIFYSLGNFAFDMRDDPTYEGLAVEFSLVKEGIVSIEVLPISIERKTFRPSIATGKKAESALKTFIRSSETLGLLCRYDESLERVVLDKFSSAD